MTDPITDEPPAGRPTKLCAAPGCGALIVRPLKISKTRWDQTRYCSRACTGTALSAKFLKTYDESRPCAYDRCDVIIRRRDGEAPARWATRRYCSRSCSARGTKPPSKTGSKVCELDGCDVVFHRRRGTGDKEWGRRRFCTAAHASASRRIEERPAKPPRERSSAPRTKTAQAKKPKPAPEPQVPVVPRIERPTWRPPWLRDYGNGLSRVIHRSCAHVDSSDERLTG